MLGPLLITLLAAWLLHESVSRLRWGLVIGGLVGALIVIRPGSGLFGLAVLYPLAAVCTYAAYQILTSRMSALDNPYTTHFWTGMIGMLLISPLLLLDTEAVLAAARAASATHWGLMLLIGMLGTTGHLLLILALGMAPTSTLMPFTYTQIPLAVGLSWLVFRQLPDGWAWVGMAVIALCGAAGAWLNLRTATVRPIDPARPEAAAPH
jgi:drug/metabolite transporter (DMT)-like permease